MYCSPLALVVLFVLLQGWICAERESTLAALRAEREGMPRRPPPSLADHLRGIAAMVGLFGCLAFFVGLGWLLLAPFWGVDVEAILDVWVAPWFNPVMTTISVLFFGSAIVVLAWPLRALVIPLVTTLSHPQGRATLARNLRDAWQEPPALLPPPQEPDWIDRLPPVKPPSHGA